MSQFLQVPSIKHHMPKLQKKQKSNPLWHETENFDSTNFFSKRNSRKSSCQRVSNKNTSVGDCDHSPEIQSRGSNQFLRSSMGSNIAKNTFKKPQKVLSSQFLPVITKELGPDFNQQKMNHSKYKEFEILKKEKTTIKKVVQQNLRSTSDSNVIKQLKDLHFIGKPNNKKKSSFAAQKQKKYQRSLEEAVIEDVLVYRHSSQNVDTNCDCEQFENVDSFFSHLEPIDTHRRNILSGHEITAEHRAKMLDWMLLVFRALKVSSTQTYFQAVAILDRYCESMSTSKQYIITDDLYLLGLTCIYISSKLEDVIAIRMRQIVEDAGHHKFKQSEVVLMEKQILKTLGFQLLGENIYEESMILLKNLINIYQKHSIAKEELDYAFEYLLFICELVSFNLDLYVSPFKILKLFVVKSTLNFLSRKFLYQFDHEENKCLKDQHIKNFQSIKVLKKIFKDDHIIELTGQDIKELNIVKQQFNAYIKDEDTISSRKNFLKTFPQFYGEESLPYTFATRI